VMRARAESAHDGDKVHYHGEHFHYAN